MEFEIPKELMSRQLAVLEAVKQKGGKIRAGINEVTKIVERGKAKLVLVAMDVSPKEVVMHIPVLCKEKKIPFSFVNEKKELGKHAGLHVPTSSIVIISEGEAKKEFEELVNSINKINKAKE